MASNSPPRPAPSNAVRYLGRFQLLRLIGKSARSMLWLVSDPRIDQELMLAMPRSQPGAEALQRWLDNARRASRIDHPGLAHVVEVGEHERWPYIAYDRGTSVTLAENLGAKGFAPAALVPWVLKALQGLAFAHEAGVAHHDLQACHLVLGEGPDCRLLGLGVALPPTGDSGSLPAQRRAAERDVLAMGLLLHYGLGGVPALDLADTGQVIERMPPLGRDIVRLPFTVAHVVHEALRAIVNRATDRQERQRYRNARTLERALDGWLRVDGEPGGGPILLLLDRMRAMGLLPAMPGGAGRAAQLASLERQRTDELAEIVIQDVGLTCELLRTVNGAKMRGALGGSGAILTIRRCIEMLGLDGVRRASLVLRPWPGPLNEAHAADMAALFDRVRLAGKVAQWLRPAGYDPEVVYLLAMLQNMGRLAVQYHFADEAAQIRRLMRSAPPTRAGDPEDPGMSEEGAACAVLGVSIDALGAAVGRHWGLDDAVLHMMRRVPLDAPVHHADADGDALRLTASCANEVVDARSVPAHRRMAFLHRVVQRYGRALGVTQREVLLAAQGIAPDQDGEPAAESAPGPLPVSMSVPMPAPATALPLAADGAVAGLRAKAEARAAAHGAPP